MQSTKKPAPSRESGIERKLRRVERALDAMETGRWPELTITQCTDYIAWLARFQKVPHEVWKPLCDRATEILENQLAVFGGGY